MSENTVQVAATGRRKTSVARVRLSTGEGKIVVNDRPYENFFAVASVRQYIEQPLALTNSVKKYDILAQVKGGGPVGQAGALRHALARALVLADIANKEALKSSGCLTRDPRMKERKKSGQPGARKRFQFSKR